MFAAHKRNPLVSWYIGLALIVACVGYVGRQMYATDCMAHAGAQLIILVAIPVIYLVLMFLTLRSQP